MRLLIVGAMDSEIEFIKSNIKKIEKKNISGFDFYLGNISNKEIILVKSGIGRVMAGLLIGVATTNFQFDAVINLGVAGGTQGTKLGDIIIGRNYVYGDVDLSSGGFGYEFGQMAGCPKYFKSGVYMEDNEYSGYYLGDMCTCDSFTTSADLVSKIQNTFKDLDIKCFDMESTAFAQACNFYNKPFLAIRSISDVIGSSFQSEDYKNNEVISANKVNQFVIKLIEEL